MDSQVREKEDRSPTQPAQKSERKDKTQDPPRNQRINHEDPVEEASDESFPASDPPASY